MKLAIEIDHGNDELFFRPIQRTVRGTFDLMRNPEPMSKVRAAQWPAPIPSQRLGIDGNNGFIEEPLHDDEFKALRDKIEGMGLTLEPKRHEFLNIDVNTWLFWIKRAVDSGIAKVVEGKLPSNIDEEKAKKNFISADPVKNKTVDRLTEALERQNALFEKLIEKLA